MLMKCLDNTNGPQERKTRKKVLTITPLHSAAWWGRRQKQNKRKQKPKKIFAQADKHGARFVYLIGPDEAKANSGNLKNLKTGEQSIVALIALPVAIAK